MALDRSSLSERDKKLLDSESVLPLTWEDCKGVIASGDLERFIRSPDQIKEYLTKRAYFNENYGGTANFVVQERLCWSGNLEPASDKFLGDANDIKILLNDFPYYFEKGIVHYVVWSKARGAITEAQQFTSETASVIDDFLDRTYSPLGVKPDEIIWFKNTNRLQSVPTLEHFHVLVRNHEPLTSLLGTAGALQH